MQVADLGTKCDRPMFILLVKKLAHSKILHRSLLPLSIYIFWLIGIFWTGAHNACMRAHHICFQSIHLEIVFFYVSSDPHPRGLAYTWASSISPSIPPPIMQSFASLSLLLSFNTSYNSMFHLVRFWKHACILNGSSTRHVCCHVSRKTD